MPHGSLRRGHSRPWEAVPSATTLSCQRDISLKVRSCEKAHRSSEDVQVTPDYIQRLRQTNHWTGLELGKRSGRTTFE